MDFVDMLARVVGRLTAVALALACLLVVSMSWGQTSRDYACSERLRAAVALIEAKRKQLGHLPSASELKDLGDGRVSLYYRMVDEPEKLRALGAVSADDYTFAQWRAEKSEYYYSWNGEDTCGSGAWILLPALALPLAGASVLLLRLSRRRQRKV